MTPLDRLSAAWWTLYGNECAEGLPGVACAQLAHIVEEEREIALLDRQGRVLDGIALLRWVG